MHFLVSSKSIFSTSLCWANFLYIIPINFSATLVFSVSFFIALKVAIDFLDIFPIACFAASIFGTTVLNSSFTSLVFSSIIFFVASISFCFFSAFSLFLFAFSVSSIILSNLILVSSCFLSNSFPLIAKLCFSSFTIFSV